MATRMQQRRGTAAEWTAANPVLGNGELGYETDTKILKMGDGVTAWNALTTNQQYLRVGATATDSAKLGGFTPNQASVANSVVVQDASADITVRSVHSEYATLSTTPNFILTQNATGTGVADNMARPVTLAQLKTSLGKMNDSDLLDGLDSTAFVRHSTVTAAGDLLLASGAGVVGRLGKGTNGQGLVVDGSGNVTWATPAANTDTTKVLKTGDTMTGTLIAPAVYAGASATAQRTEIQNASIEVGQGRTATGVAYIDFHSTVGSDYDGRIRVDTNAVNIEAVGGLFENGVRVYSATTPPPASGASIKQVIRGAAAVSSQGANIDYQDFTIPAVNIAKSFVSHVGGGDFRDSGAGQSPYPYMTARASLINSTTLRVYTYVWYNLNGSYTYYMAPTWTPFQYEIIEWT